MKRSMAVVILAMTTALAGCGNGEAAIDRPDADTTPHAAPLNRHTVTRSGTPEYAAVFPGGQVSGTPTLSNGPTGPGGIVSFTTHADPATVVAHYQRQAEAAGLASVMAMNQSGARAYGAAAADGSGASLQVVADPVDDGTTAVQLTWSAGR
ncbi:hypothetical protein [uncultured Brevundimonas sp.]|uniref:hypothetical protein n=1 Tax=uncultured Brevundimonas sp. TaxID=213418 RepID=UPI0030EC7901|tara:strand:- start:18843 stop:19298 length:456 start_codon:yes stop_codon:yes gene_type:complete